MADHVVSTTDIQEKYLSLVVDKANAPIAEANAKLDPKDTPTPLFTPDSYVQFVMQPVFDDYVRQGQEVLHTDVKAAFDAASDVEKDQVLQILKVADPAKDAGGVVVAKP